MHILRLLELGSSKALRRVVVITCLAGLANAALIGLINQMAERAALAKPIGLGLALLYVGIFVYFCIVYRASLREANRFVQERLNALRLRVVDKIRHADLRTIETLGHGELYAAVAQEINHLTQTFPLLVGAAQSGFLLLFCLLYIAILSLVSFLVVAAFTAVALYIFWLRRKSLNEALGAVYAREAEVLDSLSHFTDGFQEIRLNADKSDSLFEHFQAVTENLRTTVVGVGGKWVVLLQFSNAYLHALVGVVVFVLPIFFEGYTGVIYKIAAAAIFCVGPVTAITSIAPIYAKAEVGLGNVHRLEEKLDRSVALGPIEAREPSPFRGFRNIVFEGITFNYRAADGTSLFTSGPWNFTLRHGETVFLTGGNGSGKSTAMKLMCGLYAPEAGRILVDGTPVDSGTRQEYREIFSAIFADFHLFDRLHGMASVDPAQVNALIASMELSDKVTFADGRLSTIDLSTGQRKRLAMIISLLEDRDVYLFDEWAADQDAHFREKFYSELLPDLRRRGKTIVAVTHDDRYWSYCDRRVALDLGKMQPAAGA
jgi:putative ATP-binding cassette transporter